MSKDCKFNDSNDSSDSSDPNYPNYPSEPKYLFDINDSENI